MKKLVLICLAAAFCWAAVPLCHADIPWQDEPCEMGPDLVCK